MSRPTVPHCKECSSHRKVGDYLGFTNRVRFGHYCELQKRWITGQEVRTCPSWCPKRARGLRSAR